MSIIYKPQAALTAPARDGKPKVPDKDNNVNITDSICKNSQSIERLISFRYNRQDLSYLKCYNFLL